MSLAARIVAEAQGGDLAAAGCRVATAQWRGDLNNPGMDADERRRRFDQVVAATRELIDRTPKEEPRMTDLTYFEITVPLTRHNEDGSRHTHDVTLRFPSTDEESAEKAGAEIAWAIVTNLPSVGDNNRFGWKIANYGVAVEVAR